MSDDLPFPADFLFAQRCLDGETAAIRQFQEAYRPVVVAYLRQAGALEWEAEEVTSDLWTDLMTERPGRGPRLATYAGKAALKSWLYPLGLNRLIARKRKENTRARVECGDLGIESRRDVSADTKSAADSETPLIDLMRDAVEAGFQACPPEDFVLLQLAHLDRLHLVELAAMFNCSKSKIDRDLGLAGKKVAEATMRYVRDIDPWLDLQWEDFIELCRVATPACFGTD